MTTQTKCDVHQAITNQIITAIEAGAGMWQMPWHQPGDGLGCPKNIASGNHYRGVNIVALWASAQIQGFSSGIWGTYRQWQAKNCQVRKGEKSSVIVFYKELEYECEATGQGDPEFDKVLFARASRVFNADQVDGFEAESFAAPLDPVKRIDQVDRFVVATAAKIQHGGERAYYQPSIDTIHMPLAERFFGSATSSATEAYYATLLHELTHWTGHKSRCDRDFADRFNKEAYAMEELVAELGAAFLCAELSVTPEPRADHAQYIEHWLKVMRADKKAIFTAASQAARACDWLKGLQPPC